MSRSLIYAFNKGGRRPRREMHQTNAWWGIMYIQEALLKRYLPEHEKKPYYSLDVRYKPLHKLVCSGKLPDHQLAVQLATYQRALILPQHFLQFTTDLRDFVLTFPESTEHDKPHLLGWADFVHAHRRTADGIGFHMHSAEENLWYEEDEEGENGEWLDIAEPENYFDIYARLREIRNGQQTEEAIPAAGAVADQSGHGP